MPEPRELLLQLLHTYVLLLLLPATHAGATDGDPVRIGTRSKKKK